MNEGDAPFPARSLDECRAVLAPVRYLMISLVPFHRDAEGHVWIDALWHRDLLAHTDYLADLTILAPQWRERPQDEGLMRVMPPEGGRLRFTALSLVSRSAWEGLRNAPAVLRTARAAVKAADVVHSGVAGWPIPPGVFVNPVALAARKPLVIVIESAFWRIPDAALASRKRRLSANLTERFARWSLQRARLALYTHSGYRDSLPPGPGTTAAVIPASWISVSDVLDASGARAAWDSKPRAPRFLFASRLVGQKGADIVLAALERLEAEGTVIDIDVIGTGDLRQAFADLSVRLRRVRLGVRDPVPYGPPFLELLRAYHAIVVPTVGDEQPRILYDAFAQSVPAIASDTAGNRATLTDGREGWLFEAGSAAALAERLAAATRAPATLRSMGEAALGTALRHTHEGMHLDRARLLAGIFGVSPPATAPATRR